MNKSMKTKDNFFRTRFLSTLRGVFAIILFASVISAGIVKADYSTDPVSTLYFTQGSDLNTAITDVPVTNGGSFSLSPTINTGYTGVNTGNPVSIVSLKMNFDKTKLTLTGITAPSSYSSTTPFYNSETVGFDPSGDLTAFIASANSSGNINFDLSVGTSHLAISGVFGIATLTFSTKAAGIAAIDFATATGAAADGVTGNAILTKTNATATVAAGADVTPPVLSAGLPTGTLVAGTTNASVNLSTNESATCKYSTTSGVAYASMTGSFLATGGTTHSFLASGLANGGSYGYFIRCQDTTGNPNVSDYLISFSVANPVVNSDSGSSSKKDSKSSTPARTVTNSKTTVKFGATLTQRGKKFSKNTIIQLYFSKPGGGYYPPTKIKTSSNGSFVINYKVNKPKGQYGWYALDTKNGRKSKVVHYKVK